jgi:hypothetical protein
MFLLTSLPAFITMVVRGMPGTWKHQHRLLLCWLMVLQAVYPGRKTLAKLHRWSPQGITAWRFRRVLNASYWCVHLRIAWLADDVMATLPPPEDGTIAAIGDGSHTNTRARKNPPLSSSNRPSRGPSARKPLRRSRHPSCPACPDREKPRHAVLCAAFAGRRGVLGEPPARRTGRGRRRRWTVAAAG